MVYILLQSRMHRLHSSRQAATYIISFLLAAATGQLKNCTRRLAGMRGSRLLLLIALMLLAMQVL
jgi:hypothetical protein